MSRKYVPRSLREKGSTKSTTRVDKSTALDRPSPKPRPNADGTVSFEVLDKPKSGSTKLSPTRRPAPQQTRRPIGRPRPLPPRRKGGIGPLRRSAVYLSAVAFLILLVGGTSFFFHQREQAIDNAVADAQAEGILAVQAVLSYDYRSFDSSKSNGLSHLTGDRAAEYSQQMDALRPKAEEEKAVVDAVATGAGVVSVTRDGVFSFMPKKVELLIYANQTRRNESVTGSKVDQPRVTVVMEYVKGHWRATDFQGI